MSQKLCACGCGMPVRMEKHTYLHGHNATGGVHNNLVQREQKLCACGCGLPVQWQYGTYRRGHNQAAKVGKQYKPKVLALCACGCGQQVKTAGSTYCRGHSNTPKNRQASSERMRANNPMWDADAAARSVANRNTDYAKMGETRKRLFREGKIKPAALDADTLQQFSERMKVNNPMHDSDVVAKVAETRRKTGADEQTSERLRQRWEDPEYRAAQVKRMKTKNPMFKPENVEKALRNRALQGEPSKMELWFSDLCEQNEFQIWYSGLGDFWVNGRNPDFKVHSRKLVIEITDGYTYRQSERTVDSYALPTIEHYQTSGFGCLVVMMPSRRSLWKDDLRESLTQAIRDFIATGKSSVWTFKK